MATKRKRKGVNFYKPTPLKKRIKQVVRKIMPRRSHRRTKKTLN